MRIDGPGVGRLVVPPHLAEQPVSRNHLPPTLDEHPQELEFLGAQIDGLAVPGGLVGIEVDVDRAKAVVAKPRR